MPTLLRKRHKLNHASAEDRVRYAFEGRVSPAVEAHVDSCAACRAEILQLLEAGEAMGRRLEATDRTPACLDDRRLAELADETLPAAAREAALEHLAGCARCRAALTDVAGALRHAEVAREVGALETTEGRRRRARYLIPAAAAAVIALLLLPRVIDRTSPETHRSASTAEAPAPVPLGPAGPSGRPSALRWHPMETADRYRVTLYAGDGTVLFETTLADTVAGIPDSVSLVAGETYYWTVSGRTALDRWSTSRPVEFNVPPAVR